MERMSFCICFNILCQRGCRQNADLLAPLFLWAFCHSTIIEKVFLKLSLILVLFFVGCASPKTLRVHVWPDYLSAQSVRDFEKKNRIKVEIVEYLSNEELLDRFVSGEEIDVAFPSDYMVSRLIENEFLYSWSAQTTAALKDEFVPFVWRQDFDPSRTYSIPHAWGSTGVLVKKDYLRDLRSRGLSLTWKHIFEASELKNNVVLLDDPLEVFMLAFLALGYRDWSTITEREVDKAYEFIRKNRERISFVFKQTHFAARKNLCVVCHAYLARGMLIAHEDPSYVYVIPEEGGTVWFDNVVVAQNSENKEKAKVFALWMSGAEAGAAHTLEFRQPTGHKLSRERLPIEIQNNESIFPKTQTLDRLVVIQNRPKIMQLVYSRWTQLKDLWRL
jgi:spermidine/putrescine transport system substrate-binding protein